LLVARGQRAGKWFGWFLGALVGGADVRYWKLALLMSAAAVSAVAATPSAKASAQWEKDGRSFFSQCEYKRAARSFEKAVAQEPDRAVLHFWLGKSYARLADMSSLLTAPANARKARRSLEAAVRIEPQNQEYLLELFDFYVDSPEWFHGGLERAEGLLTRIPSGSTREILAKEIADSREDHSGTGWWIRMAVLRTSGAAASVVPVP
jgi:tetratricopeptide (TPR) repeat protein